jgi:hypothetical protein
MEAEKRTLVTNDLHGLIVMWYAFDAVKVERAEPVAQEDAQLGSRRLLR